jgi:hypothetical protein
MRNLQDKTTVCLSCSVWTSCNPYGVKPYRNKSITSSTICPYPSTSHPCPIRFISELPGCTPYKSAYAPLQPLCNSLNPSRISSVKEVGATRIKAHVLPNLKAIWSKSCRRQLFWLQPQVPSTLVLYHKAPTFSNLMFPWLHPFHDSSSQQ